MTWIVLAVMFVVGVALVAFGAMFLADPEGRGWGIAYALGGAGVLLAAGAAIAAFIVGILRVIR